MLEQDNVITCKYCGSTDVVKIGFHADTQRYLCREEHNGAIPQNRTIPLKYTNGSTRSRIGTTQGSQVSSM
jgi:hypothetical protein